jgi:hypothetical protein
VHRLADMETFISEFPLYRRTQAKLLHTSCSLPQIEETCARQAREGMNMTLAELVLEGIISPKSESNRRSPHRKPFSSCLIVRQGYLTNSLSHVGSFHILHHAVYVREFPVNNKYA